MRQHTAMGVPAGIIDPELEASTIEALAGELDQDDQRIAGELIDVITDELQRNPREAARTGRPLAANGHYAVAQVRRFAEMVDVFDTEVNRISTQYHTSVGATRRSQAMAISQDEDRTRTLAEDLDVGAIKASAKASLQLVRGREHFLLAGDSGAAGTPCAGQESNT